MVRKQEGISEFEINKDILVIHVNGELIIIIPHLSGNRRMISFITITYIILYLILPEPHLWTVRESV